MSGLFMCDVGVPYGLMLGLFMGVCKVCLWVDVRIV